MKGCKSIDVDVGGSPTFALIVRETTCNDESGVIGRNKTWGAQEEVTDEA
jgi:hypothetical protein